MRDYRLYHLDGEGRIVSAEWLSAEDDAAAIELARGVSASAPLEVWDRNRLVVRVDPSSGPASA